MKSLILGLLLLPITITAVQLESTVAVAQGQAAQDYQKGREAFLSLPHRGLKALFHFITRPFKLILTMLRHTLGLENCTLSRVFTDMR